MSMTTSIWVRAITGRAPGGVVFLLGALGWFGGVGHAEEVVYRDFTNKEGKRIEARVVELSPDRKMVKIAQRDGREFELEIVLLSLDDQQVLREWLLSQPMVRDLRMDVAIGKISERSTKREKDQRGFYRLTTEFPQYRISLTNLDRESVITPILEYCVLRRERVSIVYDEDERDWGYSSTGGDEGRIRKFQGKIELEDLVFNRQQIVTTPAVEIERVLGDGNFLYGEDELIGVRVRLVDGRGNSLGDWASSEAEIGKYTWDQAIAFDAAPESANPAASSPPQ